MSLNLSFTEIASECPGNLQVGSLNRECEFKVMVADDEQPG
jgi:hypothetical protein